VKLRIAKKILLFSERGFEGMTRSQRRRERSCRWNKSVVGRAFDRLRKAERAERRRGEAS
jgi:hypothetical protein